MISCIKCGTENKDGAKFCKACGSGHEMCLPTSVTGACQSCGAAMVPGAKFCKKCGIPAAAAKSPISANEPSIIHAAAAPQNPVSAAESETPHQPQTLSEPQQPAAVAAKAPAFLPPTENNFSESNVESIPTADSVKETPSSHSVTYAADTDLAIQAPAKSKVWLWVTIGAIVVLAIGGGSLFWWHNFKPVVPETSKTDNAALPPPIVDKTPDKPIPASPTIPVLTAPPSANPEQATKPEPVAKETSQPIKTAKPVEPPDPMARKISALIAKAESYIANAQYDKAIATAESVLEMEPGNKSAKAVLSKAKARQMDALKSGSSLE